jgi:hypothetical protein
MIKKVLILAGIAAFVACKKYDMETLPHSFVTLSEDAEGSCSDYPMPCLPIHTLEDVRWQVYTDFPPGDDAYNYFLLAIPCGDDVTDFIDLMRTAFLVTNPGGNAHTAVITYPDGHQEVQFTVDGLLVPTPQAGELFFCSGDAGGRYRGWHVITDAVEDDIESRTLVTVATPPDGLGNILSGVPRIGIGSGNGIQAFIDPGLELEQSLWDFSGVLGTLDDIDECFSFCIYKISFAKYSNTYLHELLGETGCFIKTDDLCNSSVIEYSNRENSMGFIADYPQRARMWFSLNNVQYPGGDKGYQRSDGTFLKVFERANKSYTLFTGLLPDRWHQCLRIALSCDNVNINGKAVYRSDNYDIDQPPDIAPHYPFRKAKTTVMERLFLYSLNSNCV